MARTTIKGQHPSNWRSRQFPAMGSQMAVWLETDSPAAALAAFDQVEALFADYERALSRFRPDSELSRLNERTGQWVVVSDLMWQVLTQALEMAAVSGGFFDPTMLNALEQAGYTTSFEQLSLVGGDGFQVQGTPFLGRWAAVELDAARQAICLPYGLRLDLGGIAKGYTAQNAVALLRQYGPGLVNASGDLAAGDGPDGYPGWPVAIRSPWTGDAQASFDLCQLWLANQALASSGIDYRTWEINGQPRHHLIDPATGAPASNDCLTATVLGEDAAAAEAWATAAMVGGSAAGMDALVDAAVAGLMVTRTGEILMTPQMSEALQLAPAT
ncbi:MAG: FAD:protein FMN transferase [Chloroflexota bacterium]|jgi:thiamine biosynthesis lipoprotein